MYNTEDESLQLWCCHPERICINCNHLWTISENVDYRVFSMRCGYKYTSWTFLKTDGKAKFIEYLLIARNCKYFEPYD